MRELNSLAVYIDENKELFHIKDTYQNHFAPYVMQVEKLSKHANSVPVEDIDKLLKAAQTDHMAYCIIIFLYRMGFTSTEITEIKPDNISVYENGAYIRLVGHNRASYIPEDVFQILENYMKERESYEYLFYNKYGNKLNTMYISRMLKIMAKELQVPVLCLSQLSRANEKRDDKRPMLSDLRESGAIEQDADIVMFLYRDDYYNSDSEKRNIAECIVAKNRHGETGKVELRWMPEYTTFATLENRYDEDE